MGGGSRPRRGKRARALVRAIDTQSPASLVSRAQAGELVSGASEPRISAAECRRVYEVMVRVEEMDKLFLMAQRQGRLSFYLSSTGEEGVAVGAASALDAGDVILAQYREQGALAWRGFTLEQFADQCYGNLDGHAKGRQMPIHYGSAALRWQTISSPLATQLSHATGVALALKTRARVAREDGDDDPPRNCAVAFFGEGAASEGDFHAALNFAATLAAPCLFVCRNNGYAISTPSREQMLGDGIASRAAGYGVHALRVDGNDALAVREAVAAARQLCVRESAPVIVEAMTYRLAHHSTSDDSTRYRPVEEIRAHAEGGRHPIARLRAYMHARGWWADDDEEQLRAAERAAVQRALELGEAKGPPSRHTLFEDVFDEMPVELRRQRDELEQHLAEFPDEYADVGKH